MNAAIVSIVFTCVAVAGAIFASPKGKFGKYSIAAVWVFAATLAFIIPSNLVVLSLLFVVLGIVAVRSKENRIYIYIASFPALPQFYDAMIPFPGINYLTFLDFSEVAALVLLGPIFLVRFLQKGPSTLKVVDTLVVTYVFLIGIMAIRDLPFTSMLRALFDQILLVLLPYIAISRSLKTPAQLDAAVKALFIGLVIVAMIGVISTLRSWNYYANLADFINFKVYTEHRNGLLRISSTLVSTLLGFLMGAALAALLKFRAEKAMPMYLVAGLAVMFAAVCFATGARGGWMAGFFALSTYLALMMFNKTIRRMYLLGLFVGISTVISLVFQDSSLIQDQYGTFSYRAELLRTSISQIADRPFFGSADIMSLPRFQHLRQGEGIIDLVNAYLQIALYNGLIGLGLYAFANWFALKAGLRMFAQLPAKGADESVASLRRNAALFIAMHIGFLIMIATISAVSYIWHYGFIFLGLLVALARVGQVAPNKERVLIKQESEEIVEDDADLDGPIPYGARFVRRR